MNDFPRVRVGVAGATGYAGVELLRRLARHPAVDIRIAMGSSGSEARRVPALARIWDSMALPFDVDKLSSEADTIFLAVPEALSAQVTPVLTGRGARVFDLSGAFRLRDPEYRQRWYPHSPAVDVPLTYGMTERYRNDLPGARLIACAGCYPTAAVL